jgi:hypothetical protein
LEGGLMTDHTFGSGDRVVFFQYLDPTMASAERIFEPGQLAVVSSVNEDGGLQCFCTDDEGKITSYEGDTLFPEEVIPLSYAPKLSVAERLITI